MTYLNYIWDLFFWDLNAWISNMFRKTAPLFIYSDFFRFKHEVLCDVKEYTNETFIDKISQHSYGAFQFD